MSQTAETITIDQALKLASSDALIRSQNYELVLDTLAIHECWTIWFETIRTHIKQVPETLIADYVRMIKIYVFYLEDLENGANTCRELIQKIKMSYLDFRRYALDKVLEFEDYKTEGVLLTVVWESFHRHEDQILAVERLCFIFEKKSHNERLLHQFYERLRKMQPENGKALKYFRNLYSQSHDWPAVIEVLKKLLTFAKHKQEVFRYAQELAAVHLYQLGDCQEAIRYIEEYCSGSTLDTSTIHYEAYYRLGNLEGCLRILRSALLVVEDQSTRAVIHFRIASLLDQLSQFQLAYENYNKTLELNEEFFEAIEGLISTSIQLKNWKNVRTWLDFLAKKTRSQNLISQIRAAIQRLDEGLSYANTAR